MRYIETNKTVQAVVLLDNIAPTEQSVAVRGFVGQVNKVVRIWKNGLYRVFFAKNYYASDKCYFDILLQISEYRAYKKHATLLGQVIHKGSAKITYAIRLSEPPTYYTEELIDVPVIVATKIIKGTKKTCACRKQVSD